MKISHATAIIAAFTLGAGVPAWAVGPSQEADNPTVGARADQAKQSQSAQQSTEGKNSSQATGNDAEKNKQRKPGHGPTAVMNRATPPEKSTNEGGEPGKHPPTRVMDRETPDQKAPASK